MALSGFEPKLAPQRRGHDHDLPADPEALDLAGVAGGEAGCLLVAPFETPFRCPLDLAM
jgi:hypothetical protein